MSVAMASRARTISPFRKSPPRAGSRLASSLPPQAPNSTPNCSKKSAPLASGLRLVLRLDELDTLLFLGYTGNHGVHLDPDQHREPRDVEPEHQHHDSPELPVDLVVAGDVGGVEVERHARGEH